MDRESKIMGLFPTVSGINHSKHTICQGQKYTWINIQLLCSINLEHQKTAGLLQHSTLLSQWSVLFLSLPSNKSNNYSCLTLHSVNTLSYSMNSSSLFYLGILMTVLKVFKCQFIMCFCCTYLNYFNVFSKALWFRFKLKCAVLKNK